METRIKAFVLLSISFLFSFCRERGSEWKGTIEEIDGIKVVVNPNEPLYGQLIFDLEEDLSIGNEEDDNYIFFRIRDIQVDNEGNIYVLESGNVRVQKFDRNGNYVCTIGRKGQGPGELQRPSQVIINEIEGTIGVKEDRKLIVFDKSGKFLGKDITFDHFFYDLALDSKGSLWVIKFDQEGEDEVTADLFKALVILNHQGQMERKVVRFPFDLYRERWKEGVVLRSTGFEYDLFFSPVDEQNMIYGYSKEYEMNIIDLAGKVRLRIRKKEPYRSFAPEERGISKKVRLPESKPYFFALFSDSAGRIYAQRNNARKADTTEKEFDIFSKDGYYLYKTICQRTPYAIKEGYYFTRIQNDDTGEVFVKRFKIKNWEQIKRGI